jgi:hypothetical protein
MLTSLDIKKLQSVFATKGDLKKLENKFLSSLDAVMYELKALREDSISGAHRRFEN